MRRAARARAADPARAVLLGADGRLARLRRVGAADRRRRLARATRCSTRRRSTRICSASSTRSPAATCCSSASCRSSIGSASCALLGARRRAPVLARGPGIAAGLMLALYAPAIFFDGLLQKSVLDVFFVCLALWLIAEIDDPAEAATRERQHRRTQCSLPICGGLRLQRPSLVAGSGSDDGRPRADARERARLHRRHARVGIVGSNAARTPTSNVERRTSNDCSAPRCSSPALAIVARAGRRAQRLRRRRLLHHHLAVRAELLHRQQPVGRRHLPVAALRPRRARIRAPGRDRAGRTRARAGRCRRRRSRASGPTRRSSSSPRSRRAGCG